MRIKFNFKFVNTAAISALIATLLLTAGCGQSTGNKEGTNIKNLSGEILIDGSSTVFPITQAVAEDFNQTYRDVRIPVGVAGTGGGMKKFSAGEIDIADASRIMTEDEKANAKKNGIEYIEFKIAYDGISVVVNKSNDWMNKITVEELKKIWEPDSTVKKWKDINPAYPDAEIKLYGPGMDSGTMEYFTEEINKKKMAIRKDYTASEDDNLIVQGISGDKYAMGFFGYAYYIENKDKLKVLPVDSGSGAVAPDVNTIKNGTYKPLGRPLFIYVNKKALEKEHVKEFVNYYLTEGTKLIEIVGYVPLDDYKAELAKIQ